MSVGNNRTPTVECVPLESRETYSDVMEGKAAKCRTAFQKDITCVRKKGGIEEDREAGEENE